MKKPVSPKGTEEEAPGGGETLRKEQGRSRRGLLDPGWGHKVGAHAHAQRGLPRSSLGPAEGHPKKGNQTQLYNQELYQLE